MPFPWLPRHINTNYTDRLCFTKTPLQQTAAADGCVWCGHMDSGLCVVSWSELIKLYLQTWRKWYLMFSTYCATGTGFNLMFFLCVHLWVIMYTTLMAPWVSLLQCGLIVQGCFGQGAGKSWCLFGSVTHNLMISVPEVYWVFSNAILQNWRKSWTTCQQFEKSRLWW